MKKFLLGLLILGVAFAMGCNKEETPAATDSEDSPTAGATMPDSGMPGGMPGASGMPGGMPGASGMPGGMPGGSDMPGGMTATPGTAMTGMPGAGLPGSPAPEEQKKEMTKTLEETYKNATIIRDKKNNEVRVFINPDANILSEKSKNLSELQAREVALEFIRAQYYYFDTMSFEYRPSAGKFSNGVYNYEWIQKIRHTKKTGNTINISVNPKTGKVTKYKSTRRDWDN